MTGVLVGLVAGGAVGALAMLLIQRPRRRWRSRRTEPLTLDGGAQQLVDTTIAQHAAARRQQVTAFADRLAAGDTGLRERLRRFERGEVS